MDKHEAVTVGLIAFLRARIDEDVAVARAADPELSSVFTRIASFDPEMAADERHIMAHRPARVLREIEAKRAVIDRYEASVALLRAWTAADEPLSALTMQNAENTGLEWALRLLAAASSDHPDYREEWTP